MTRIELARQALINAGACIEPACGCATSLAYAVLGECASAPSPSAVQELEALKVWLDLSPEPPLDILKYIDARLSRLAHQEGK